MYPPVTIIILNWNGWKDTLECLESVYRINYPDFKVIVLDNGSIDESIIKIEEYKKSSQNDFIFIKNDKNYGFAEGNNIGINFALKELNQNYFLLLNNDTVVHKDFLKHLVSLAQNNDKIGVVGPKIYYYDYKGRKDIINYAGETINLYTSRGKRFGYTKRDNGRYDQIREVDKVDGSCMLIIRQVIEKVGMFDPLYFAYWEESDLCVRIKKAGFKLMYAPEACIWHKIGVNWDTYFSYFIIYHYLVRNRLIFMSRYANTPQKIVFYCFFAFYLLFNVVLMFIKEDVHTSKEGLKAIKDGIRDFNVAKIKRN